MQVEFRWLETMWTSPMMLVILLVSVITMGFILERSIYFWKRRGDAESTRSAALARIRSGDVQGAMSRLAETRHPLGPVAASVLECPTPGGEEVEERLHVALSEERLLLERNLNLIGTVGSMAPLLGLLGTTWGIMRAFDDMAKTGSAGPSVVAAGVAEALVTTGAGLLIAVPAVALFNHFQRRSDVLLTEAENGAIALRRAWEEKSVGSGDLRRAA